MLLGLACATKWSGLYFVVFFGVSWGPLMWVLLGEMFPNWLRAAALSVAAAAQWIANFFISTTFPWFSEIGLSFASSHSYAAEEGTERGLRIGFASLTEEEAKEVLQALRRCAEP